MKKKIVLVVVCVLYFCAFAVAQSSQLAQNYYDQGEFKKARSSYEKILKKEPSNINATLGLIQTQQQLEAYDEVEKFIANRLRDPRNTGTLLVEMGYNYQLQQKDSLTQLYYEKAQDLVRENPNNAYRVGKAFQEHSLLEQAVATYETGMELNPRANYSAQLARLYGELGEVEKMFDSYLALVNKNAGYIRVAQRNFSQYITDDGTNEANIIFRKLLLTKLQTEQNVMYNELLSWLFIQQKEYDKAFRQEKAIFKRNDGEIQGIVDLAGITIEEGNIEISKEILLYIIDNAIDDTTKLDAQTKLLLLESKEANTAEQKKSVKERYEFLVDKYKNWDYAIPLKIDYAHFLAFQNNEASQAVDYLKKEIANQRSRFPEARLKMELGDILVSQEKFNQALIYFSQVQNSIKNNVISQEARFKVAKTSYYKGDFSWAETQLDVLKGGATQLIANDALELLLTIRDNSQEDSTQTALKKYARADLLAFQGKDDEAISLYGEIVTLHKGESMEDEALLAQAKLFEGKSAFAKAEKNYNLIIAFFSDGILADDAHYRLAELYAGPLAEPDKAKQHYERIIFDFQDSIYYVEAQKKFRALRGDAIN
ncbi:hypothetical protein EAX61_03005 [Dokdonia sinensis]|uniref:Tetratricopeptide repeat protein n=1 Tax=Dokdonia sinensis TaxID=2479847 RepID=A0A3M0GF47_9FLAO|nr:tetratricopeptide repeat protein [Dokdonia sinensis]RMB63535.1 hypothetical protein EAX61_03005 [Dokdonia sinensis]